MRDGETGKKRGRDDGRMGVKSMFELLICVCVSLCILCTLKRRCPWSTEEVMRASGFEVMSNVNLALVGGRN